MEPRLIHSSQADYFKELFLQHVDGSYQNGFIKLMDLIKLSVDGVVTRGQLNAALYPKSEKDSITSQLSDLKKALSDAAKKCGYQLNLITPHGRGNDNQEVRLETDAPWQLPVSDATNESAEFIKQQGVIPQQAMPTEPLIAVSFADKDRELAKVLLAELETGLKARNDDLAQKIKFWDYTKIPPGENDIPTIMDVFNRAQLGLLFVSPSACASSFIQDKEWTLFRNKFGNKLKPCLAVQLYPVDSKNHDLGVLGVGEEREKGRTQLYYLYDEGKKWAWSGCVGHYARKNAFVEEVINHILGSSLSDPSSPPPSSSSKIQKLNWKEKSADILAHSCEAKIDLNVPIIGDEVSLQDDSKSSLPSQDKAPEVPKKSPFRGEIIPALKEWACNPKDTPFAVLLGEYGMGKTWNSQLLASKLIECLKREETGIPTPIYLDLRRAVDEKDKLLSGDVPTLEDLLESLGRNNTSPGKKPLTAKEIFRAVREEGALLIFDGLDEVLSHKRDDNWGQTFIRRLFDVLPFSHWPQHLNEKNTKNTKPGKLLLTCRTHYFKSVQTQNDQILGLGREQHEAARPRAWQLLPFAKEQVLKYLALHVPEQDPQAVYDLIASVHDLSEIASRPQGVKMVCEQFGEIETAKREGKTVNGATIYAWMVDKWLARDHGKHLMSEDDKPDLMQDLALYMWQLGVRQIPWNDLRKWFIKHPLCIGNENVESLLTDLRNATFLVRPGNEDFAFAHTSILEYFLAVRLYRSLEEDDVKIWEDLNPSREALDFLVQHHQTCPSYTQKKARDTLVKHLGQAEAGKAARKGLLDVFLRAPKEWPLKALNISGLSLEGYSFSRLTLDMLIADDANLAETQWSHCHFKRSSWRHTNCRQMKCEALTGTHADFSYANLSGGRWRNVRVAQIVFEQTLHLDTLQQMPAVVDRSPSRHPLHHDWRLLWSHHNGALNACSLSADGRRMLTGGDDGTARVWDEHGECLHVLKGHEGVVRACSLSADGRRMLTGGRDGTARVWDEHGECLHVPKGHNGWVLACSLSADDQRAITGSLGAIRYWAFNPATDIWKCTLELHPQTQTVIWLDAKTQTLKLKGPDWPFWQLSHSDDQVRNTLGETIAELGPMAHEQLANAAEWQFWPRDDIRADGWLGSA